jgi:dipeptide/tripeptide permease
MRSQDQAAAASSGGPTTQVNRWPPQIRYILGNEAAERFSFYGVKAILALYITSVLMMTRDDATQIIHLFGFVNYFMPLIGAWVSDRFWGRYATILWVSLSYCVGHGVMALSDAIPTVHGKVICLYIGLGLIAFGAGGIKPCVSAFMGDQFKPEQQHLLQKAYAAFYWSINLGSTASFFVIPWIHKQYGYSWAFGVPGIAMAIATFIFWLGTKHYVRIPPARKTRTAGFFAVWTYAMVHRDQSKPTQSFWNRAHARFTDAEVDAARSVGPILSIFALCPIFWALFDQTFSTWVLQGENMKPWFVTSSQIAPRDITEPQQLSARLREGTNGVSLFLWSQFPAAEKEVLSNVQSRPADLRSVLARELNEVVGRGSLYETQRFAGVNLSTDTKFLLSKQLDSEETRYLNRLLLEDSFPEQLRRCYRIGPEEMLSANPIMVMIFVPLLTWLIYPRLGRLVTPLKRMSAGMFLSAASFVVVAMLQSRVDGGEKLSVLWQTAPYLLITIAEVLFSTTGLEFAFREAAPSMKSTIIGFWWATVAFGNLFVSVLTKILEGPGTGHDTAVSASRFLLYAGMTFVVAILFSVVAAFYKYRDKAAEAGR